MDPAEVASIVAEAAGARNARMIEQRGGGLRRFPFGGRVPGRSDDGGFDELPERKRVTAYVRFDRIDGVRKAVPYSVAPTAAPATTGESTNRHGA